MPESVSCSSAIFRLPSLQDGKVTSGADITKIKLAFPVEVVGKVSLDYTDPSTIANGDLVISHDGYQINNGEKVSAVTSEWIEYLIPINYHTTTAYPTHVVVSFASSLYGDYFTGCSSSKLWIDKVELVY